MDCRTFSEQKVDVAVIEVGMGGRLDSTNVITPLLSVITNIGYDHQQFLGNTLEKIAMEKAGIIKRNIPVVVGETQTETKPVFEATALKKSAPITFADNEQEKCSYTSDLKGIYQQKNIKTAAEVFKILHKHSLFNINENHITLGLNNVVKNTGLLGRWQILNTNPLTICDTGHNKDGLTEVLKQISQTKYDKLHFVFGMVNDKNPDSILSMLPQNATYYFCKANIPRAMPAEELKQASLSYNLFGNTYSSVSAALEAANKNARFDDLIFIGGSTFVVAEVV
jgi:dihydrofolate synthase / folylpolyglutamate synthase